MKKTLGGDRLGSGKKMQVELKGFQRSTHDLGYLWRSTMAAGTLVPFMTEIALPGDTFDINLDGHTLTHPTIGPLFGSFKQQYDVFLAPIRLYHGQLHNNKLGIGLNMAAVALPQIQLFVDPDAPIPQSDPDNAQINPSCILSYLGIRGVGMVNNTETGLIPREFNALPLLAYWDIYKNYYANKQEQSGAVIHEERIAIVTTVFTIEIGGAPIPQFPTSTATIINESILIEIESLVTNALLNQIILNTDKGQIVLQDVVSGMQTAGLNQTGIFNAYLLGGSVTIYNWNYIANGDVPISSPKVSTFDLTNIDQMREDILQAAGMGAAPYIINDSDLQPYNFLLDWTSNLSPYMATQEGLAIKTYQSDLFNNWLSTDWIDGTNGINEITAIDTTSGSFNIDTVILSKKVYDMLNQIAVSGGSYDDWLDAVYDHDRYLRCETPMYMGGLIKELVFQEVVSNSEGTSTTTSGTSQPLGTLAGKGVLSNKHKGGHITIKVDEPSYIIGIVSLTPRIDYSQGNKWDTNLKTMDDLHKPALDEIGFQDLITEQMAWFTTVKPLGAGEPFVQKSAGKQPAWINYMTNVNQVRGNFAIPGNEMFMTLNRRYQSSNNGGQSGGDIIDLTTYIDPAKFNNSFAQTSLDAQNFWVQIAVDITARRKMSAKIMPNL